MQKALKRSEYEELKAQNAELTGQVKWFMEQMRLIRQKRFGASSEKSKYDQLNIFNEAEATADGRIAEPELTEIKSHYRKKAKESGDRLHIMGKGIRRELKLIPAKAVIVEHVDYVYACRDCEKNACGVPVIKAPMDNPVIKGSFASPEAVVHIMNVTMIGDSYETDIHGAIHTWIKSILLRKENTFYYKYIVKV